MRIALLYPPPWRIAPPGEPAFPPGEGVPAEYRDGDLDADFYQIPYGLLSLAAQVLRARHQVKVLNLSAFPWTQVEQVVEVLDAELFGISCWTANRRGVGMLARALRARHPKAHIVVGGPHATALPIEMLSHHPEIDSVAVGESEMTFLELIDRLANGSPLVGTAGLVCRDGNQLVTGPKRAPISNLDTLVSPHEYFDTHVFMTSRGCTWNCTFCGAETTWGRGFRALSVSRVIDDLERAVARLPVKMLQIKDDTFTTDKKRVVEICRAIREEKLGFFWSCDTRADLLTEEVVREMRLAGCERLSLGVESGSPSILRKIQKKITTDQILRSTELAKRYGIRVRYYMMLGNRGETAETFRETLAFLQKARPHQYIFSCLSIYPGTRDFSEAEKSGWLNRTAFFDEDFQELKTPFDASQADTEMMNEWFCRNRGLQTTYRETIADYRAILERLGEHHAAHLDLAGACFEAGRLDLAERHARRALELGYPLPGLVYNYLACIAKARGDLPAMMDAWTESARRDPQHFVLVQNVNAARAWFREAGPSRGLPLNLLARHDFQLLERTVQPTLPGPLPSAFGEWSTPAGEVSSAPVENSDPRSDGHAHDDDMDESIPPSEEGRSIFGAGTVEIGRATMVGVSLVEDGVEDGVEEGQAILGASTTDEERTSPLEPSKTVR